MVNLKIVIYHDDAIKNMKSPKVLLKWCKLQIHLYYKSIKFKVIYN